MKRPARAASLLTLALLLLQVGWILATPPFRGIDEFDHAYRAAAVAHGQIVSSPAPAGVGGGYVQVPSSLVEAAEPVCTSYGYTTHDNCYGDAGTRPGFREVASGAALYNPVFYWVIGKAAQPFEGTANLYVLRTAAALLCSALFWLAAYALASARRSVWTIGALGVAATPMFVYSTALGAPNGIEMTAALALWCSLIAQGGRELGVERERTLIHIATVAAAVLVTPRLLGPAWLLLIVGATALFLGPARIKELLRTHRRRLVACSAVVLVATVAALAWNRISAPNSLSAEKDLGLHNPLGHSLADLPLWAMQTMGAFPTRDEPAPALTYAAVVLALGVALYAAWLRGGRRVWMSLALLLAAWVAIQLAITVPTYAQLGPVWQGRYALPFAVGIPLLIAALAERRGRAAPPRWVGPALLALVFTAHAASIVHVYLVELGKSPLSGTTAWVAVPAPVLLFLVAAAGASAFLAFRHPSSDDDVERARPRTYELAR